MLGFLRGDADCLVATTIIESGLDIPAANTLIVERADQLGLAQAYQIRGRVGRSRERAFAYMLYPSEEALTARGRRSGWRPSPTTPSSAPGSRSRCATSSCAAPATCSATSSRATSPRSASSSTSQLLDEAVEAMRAAAGEEGAEGEREAAVRLDVDVDAYLPAGLRPLRGGEDRRPPADRRRRASPGELRALRDELRDRFGPAARAGREPARAPARPDRARRAGAPRPPRSAAAGSRSSRSISTRRRSAGSGSRSPRRSTSPRAKTLSTASSDAEPAERLAAVTRLAEALGGASAPV